MSSFTLTREEKIQISQDIIDMVDELPYTQRVILNKKVKVEAFKKNKNRHHFNQRQMRRILFLIDTFSHKKLKYKKKRKTLKDLGKIKVREYTVKDYLDTYGIDVW